MSEYTGQAGSLPWQLMIQFLEEATQNSSSSGHPESVGAAGNSHVLHGALG